jgi:hypothetical protein
MRRETRREDELVKNSDPLKVAWTALVHVMQSDARFTEAEQAGLTAKNVIQDANQPT